MQANSESGSRGILEPEVWGEDESNRRTTLGSARVESSWARKFSRQIETRGCTPYSTSAHLPTERGP